MVFLYSMFLGFSHIFFVAVYLSPLLNLCLPSFYIFLGEIRNVKSTMIMKNMILFYRHTNVFLIIMIGLLFIRCSSSSSGSGQAEDQPILRVMAYNIHHSNPPSEPGVISPEVIAEVIRRENPDLVALQEVDVNNRRSGEDLHQAEAIAEELGMYFHFAKAIDYQGGFYGNAVLSKFPILDRMDVELPAMEGVITEDRVWAGIKVDVQGTELWFGSTHLDFKTEENNLYQSDMLIRAFDEVDIPVIIAGDFNATEHSTTMQLFDEHFERTCPGDCPPTFPQIDPHRAIDFIIFQPKDAFETISHRVVEEEYASDHRPVMAELRVK